MGPRIREDDEIRKEKTELSSATKNKKLSTSPPHHQSSFPCTRETIYPHAPDAAFENALTAIDNCIEQNQQQHVNVAVTTSHTTRCTMGPRVREDDKIIDRKRLIDRSYKEEVGITKMRQDKPTAPLSHKHSAHRRHTTNCHSRAHGKPFIHTHRVPRWETYSPK